MEDDAPGCALGWFVAGAVDFVLAAAFLDGSWAVSVGP
ncbi:hypothetical protein [Alloactinosynnema sp. L-07]|nr:hypothetical protein [Alloactinosynnema sp. L-07]